MNLQLIQLVPTNEFYVTQHRYSQYIYRIFQTFVIDVFGIELCIIDNIELYIVVPIIYLIFIFNVINILLKLCGSSVNEFAPEFNPFKPSKIYFSPCIFSL